MLGHVQCRLGRHDIWVYYVKVQRKLGQALSGPSLYPAGRKCRRCGKVFPLDKTQ